MTAKPESELEKLRALLKAQAKKKTSATEKTETSAKKPRRDKDKSSPPRNNSKKEESSKKRRGKRRYSSDSEDHGGERNHKSESRQESVDAGSDAEGKKKSSDKRSKRRKRSGLKDRSSIREKDVDRRKRRRESSQSRDRVERDRGPKTNGRRDIKSRRERNSKYSTSQDGKEKADKSEVKDALAAAFGSGDKASPPVDSSEASKIRKQRLERLKKWKQKTEGRGPGSRSRSHLVLSSRTNGSSSKKKRSDSEDDRDKKKRRRDDSLEAGSRKKRRSRRQSRSRSRSAIWGKSRRESENRTKNVPSARKRGTSVTPPAPPKRDPVVDIDDFDSESSPLPSDMAFETWDHVRSGCRNVNKCYTHCNQISEGVYGVVHRAKDKETGEVVALKKIKYWKSVSGFPISSLREMSLLLDLDHPNIIRVKEIVTNTERTAHYMVMDYAENDIQYLMQVRKIRFTLPQAKCLFAQLLVAVQYLRSKWILHRDLKTSNLLLTKDGILKVCDLGMARHFGEPRKPLTALVVTLWYRAPEVLLGEEKYGPELDWWACGCVLIEFLTGRVLFPGKGEMNQLDRIFAVLGTPTKEEWPKYSTFPHVTRFGDKWKNMPNTLKRKFQAGKPLVQGGPVFSKTCQDLMASMLRWNPANRMNPADALEHDWFKEEPLKCEPSGIPDFGDQSLTEQRTELRPPGQSPKPSSPQAQSTSLAPGAKSD